MADKLCHIIHRISESAVHFKDLYCHIPMIVIVLCTLCVLCIPILHKLHIKRYLVISVLLLSVSLAVAYPFSLQKDANLLYRYDTKRETLMLGNQNDVLLIETGNASGQNAYTALTECNSTLEQTGIDHLVLTHYHAASTEFAKYLLENTYLETVFLPNPKNETDTAISESIVEVCKQNGIQSHLYDHNKEISILDFSIRIHNEILNRSEHPAQGIEIVCQNTRVLAADPALFELDGIGAPDLSGVDYLIFLSSPPTDKYKLPSFAGANGVHAVFGSYDQKNVIGCPFGNFTVLCPEDPTVSIWFP